MNSSVISSSSSSSESTDPKLAEEDVVCVFCMQPIYARLHDQVTFACGRAHRAHLGCLINPESDTLTTVCIKCMDDGKLTQTVGHGRGMSYVSSDPRVLESIYYEQSQLCGSSLPSSSSSSSSSAPNPVMFAPNVVQYGSLSPSYHLNQQQEYATPLYDSIEDQVQQLCMQMRQSPDSGIPAIPDWRQRTSSDRLNDSAVTIHVLNQQRTSEAIGLWQQIRGLNVDALAKARMFVERGFSLIDLLSLFSFRFQLPNVNLTTLFHQFGINLEFLIGMGATWNQLQQLGMTAEMLTNTSDQAKLQLVKDNELRYLHVLSSGVCQHHNVSQRWQILFGMRFPAEALQVMKFSFAKLLEEQVYDIVALRYLTLQDMVEKLELKHAHVRMFAQKVNVDFKVYCTDYLGWSTMDMRKYFSV